MSKSFVIAMSLSALVLVGCGGGGGSQDNSTRNPELTYGEDELPIIDGTYYAKLKPYTYKCSDGSERFSGEKNQTIKIWVKNGFLETDSKFQGPANSVILDKKYSGGKLNIDGTAKATSLIKMGIVESGYRFIATSKKEEYIKFVKDGFVMDININMNLVSENGKYNVTCSGNTHRYGVKVN